MKKLKLFCAIVIALLAVSLTGCKPNADEEDFTYDSIGEWMIGDWDIASESTMKMSIQGMPEYDTNETQAIKGTINIEGIEDDSIVTMSYEDGSSDEITFKEFVEANLIPSEERTYIFALLLPTPIISPLFLLIILIIEKNNRPISISGRRVNIINSTTPVFVS
jgi:hypothetical protein